ncbi:MAG: hypothetical protein WC227_02360 [Patescibacteria group bacterium]|jgi:DNA polymerase III delta prime subunit
MDSKDLLNLQNDWQDGNFYHAYLVLGNREESERLVNLLCEKSGTSRKFVTEIGDSDAGIKIDQIRELIHSANLTKEGLRIIVLWDAETMNISASNALLKILEEPPAGVVFLLQSKNQSLSLTIKSRCRLVRLANTETKNHTSSYQINFADNLHVLLKQIEKVVKGEETEAYLLELVFLVRNDMIETKKSSLAEALTSIERTRQRIGKNANPRLALENLIIEIKDIYERDIFQG